MAHTVSHEPLADVSSGAYPHAQAIARILVHDSHFGAHEYSPVWLGGFVQVDNPAEAAVPDRPSGRLHPAGNTVEESRFAGTGFSHDSDYFSRAKGKVHITAADTVAVALAQLPHFEEGRSVRGLSGTLAHFLFSWCRFGLRFPGLFPSVAGGDAAAAIVRIRAHEEATATVVDYDLVEVALPRSTQRAISCRSLRFERIVFEVQTLYARVGRDGVDALLPPGPENLQCRHAVHFGIVELGNGRGGHNVPAMDQHGIVESGRDSAVPGNVFIELHMHDAVFSQGMHAPAFPFTGLQTVGGRG